MSESKKTVFVVGLGPGGGQFLTVQAQSALQQAEVLCGYTVYIDLVRPLYPEKECYTTGMTREIDRCRWALDTARAGRDVALVCSGDAGVYGMASPLLELAVREDPQNDRNCHYLGREYMFRGEWQKAIETLTRHLTLPSAVWADERCASMRYIARCLRALEQDDSAERWLHRAVAEAPHLREPYMDYAQLLYAQERWYGLVDVLRTALAITERPRTYICEADAWGSLPYDLLSLAYAHLGDAENAADACRNAVERSPQEERLRKNLALFEQMRER